MRRFRLSSCILLLTAACGDCGDIDNTTGNSQLQRFQANNVRALFAVGSRFDLRIRDAESFQDNEETEVISANVEQTAVANVLELVEEIGLVTVGAVSPGEATLQFTGLADEEYVDDSFILEIREANGATVEACGGNSAAVFRNQAVIVQYELFDNSELSSGQGLSGYGFLPFSIEPPEAATILADQSTQGSMYVRVEPNAPDFFDVVSNWGDEVELTVVEDDAPRTIEAIAERAAINEGKTTAVQIALTVDSLPFCQPIAITGRVLAGPCSFNGDQERTAQTYSFEVRGDDPGICELEFRSGNGAAAVVEMTVNERPSGGGGGFDGD